MVMAMLDCPCAKCTCCTCQILQQANMNITVGLSMKAHPCRVICCPERLHKIVPLVESILNDGNTFIWIIQYSVLKCLLESISSPLAIWNSCTLDDAKIVAKKIGWFHNRYSQAMEHISIQNCLLYSRVHIDLLSSMCQGGNATLTLTWQQDWSTSNQHHNSCYGTSCQVILGMVGKSKCCCTH
jgi:hypothetical protein